MDSTPDSIPDSIAGSTDTEEEIYPFRARPGAARNFTGSPAKLWATLRQSMKKLPWDDVLDGTEGENLARLLAVKAGLEAGTAPEGEEEAAMAALLDHPWALTDAVGARWLWQSRLYLLHGWDRVLAVLHRGLSRGWVEGSRRMVLVDDPAERRGGGLWSGDLRLWLPLRRMLCALPEAEWVRLRDLVAAWLPQSSPIQGAALAFLFPDADFVPGVVARAAAQGRGGELPQCLLFSAPSADWLDRLLNAPADAPADPPIFSDGLTESSRSLCRTLLWRFGRGAIPLLLRMLPRDDDGGIREVLAGIDDPRVLPALLHNLDVPFCFEHARRACLRDPGAAIAPLQQAGIGRTRAAQAARLLLSGLQLTTGDSAPDSALPRVLREPPWLQKRPARRRQPPITLPPCPTAVRWEQDQREEWLAARAVWPQTRETEIPADTEEPVVEVLEYIGLDAAFAPLAADRADDPALFSALCAALDAEDVCAPDVSMLELLPDRMALEVWNRTASSAWGISLADLRAVMAWLGPAALPGLLALPASHARQRLEVVMPFGAPEVARHMAAAFGRQPHRAQAIRWLRAWPEVAVQALLPPATGADPAARQAAPPLRHLAAAGFRARMEAALSDPAALAALALLLDRDPLSDLPAKRSALQTGWMPPLLPAPVLASGPYAGMSLPPGSLPLIAAMLHFTELSTPYAGIADAGDACTPASLAAFAAAAFQHWDLEGRPAAGRWALKSLAFWGDEAAIRLLGARLRAWITAGDQRSALPALPILAAHPSPVGLLHLAGTARARQPALRQEAERLLSDLAARRGLLPGEFADQLVPDLGLDAAGRMQLDFGPRCFEVRLDTFLQPRLYAVSGADAGAGAGAPLQTLPRPLKSDDPALAAEAAARWAALRQDLKEISRQQLRRFEEALCSQQAWPHRTFRDCIADHPLLSGPARRLLWEIVPAGEDAPIRFRIAEDGSAADVDDLPMILPPGADVRLSHPLRMSAAARDAWARVFGDYGIAQPFPQLAREFYALTPSERASPALTRWEGRSVQPGPLYGLLSRGWERGGGGEAPINRIVGNFIVELELEPGLSPAPPADQPPQRLGKVRLYHTASSQPRPFGALSPVLASECLRDISGL